MRALRELLRRPLLFALVVVAFVLVVPGGLVVVAKVVMDRREERRRVRVALREAAAMFGLVPDYLDAIGKRESEWTIAARSTDPRDEARGGSFGPTQISERTARAHGYTGSMERFREDPRLAAEWTGRILRAAEDVRHLETFADYCAAWNAGRYDADRDDDGDLDELPPTHPTRAEYLPRALVALAYVERNPPA